MNNYYEYMGEIPINTLKTWQDIVMRSANWQPAGWSGAPKEPFRHWCAYPDFVDEYKIIWECLNESFKEDGLILKPSRVIVNVYQHGDSSWLHYDSEDKNSWTAILYMNEHWDLNWGGGTALVEDGEYIKVFAPTPGKFILFRGNILHGPLPVSREAPVGRIGLTFQCDSNL